MEPGTTVRLKADPGRVGIITGKTRRPAGNILWQVKFPDGADYQRENYLEIVPDDDEDPIELLRLGKLGRARDLRGNLTHIRLNGRLANLIYSMNITNTDFYPYQFKPVINFLDAPSNGLLIADEVGLGKTIEAGLIWTEMRSRFDIRRVMVLCPAMLREKWRSELIRRFGIDANILGSSDVLNYFREYKSGERQNYAIISSMQGLRPRRGWNRGNENTDDSSFLSRFLEAAQYEEPLLDLLIIDEAHYLRNPESMTSRLGRLLRAVSDYVVLLSATPIHLRNRDLYQLLNLVDENTFNQPNVFDEILEVNEPLIRLREMVLGRSLDQKTFVSMLKVAQAHPFFAENRQIREILLNPPSDDELSDKAFRTMIANRLENINLLGRSVNRTRKRDVTEWQVIREPVSEMVQMSDPERNFYTEVTGIVREYALTGDNYEGFLLVMPQRQMSSSMPAAIAEWQRRNFRIDEQAYEDLGLYEVSEDLGPLTTELVNRAYEMGNYEELRENDSKYRRLRKVLTRHLNKYPNEKVVLFAYFRPTLRYLNERLEEDGISSLVLMGGIDTDKYEIIDTFMKKDGPSVLLSSEVASEGVDLQFARVLINYDLPWNPMKVEQRIGRIDRLGQKSPKITIWNLFYEDSIDARIYNRLYDRLGIFKRALGGLEGVLGDEIRNLTQDLLLGQLSKNQENERIQQTEQAISNIRSQEEKLESEAGNLVAHGDYILNQIKAARELNRCITSNDLWVYIRDFFNKEYTGSDFKKLDPDKLIFDVKLSNEAKYDLDRFITKNKLQGQTRLSNSYPPKIRCKFENQVSPSTIGRTETISQFHPLVRFVGDCIRNSSFRYYSPVSVEISNNDVPNLLPGVYVFSVERWSIKGIREIERMYIYAKNMDEKGSTLSDDDAEKLVTTAARIGRDWQAAANSIDLDTAVYIAEKCLETSESEYDAYVKQLQYENNDRADVQEKSLNRHRNRQLEKLENLLERQRNNEKVARMTKGRIDALNSRVQQKMLEIDSRRQLNHHKKEVCIGLT